MLYYESGGKFSDSLQRPEFCPRRGHASCSGTISTPSTQSFPSQSNTTNAL